MYKDQAIVFKTPRTLLKSATLRNQ